MNSSNPQSAAETHNPQAFLNDALAGVEQGLAQLKRMYKDAEDTKRAAEAARSQIDSEREQIQSKLAEAESLRADLDRQREELRKNEDRVNADRGALEELTAEHRRLCEEFEGRRSALDNEVRGNKEFAASLADRESKLKELEADLNRRRGDIQNREAALHSACEELDKSTARVEELRKGLEAREAELNTREESLKKSQAEVEQTRQEIAKRTDELKKLEERARRDGQESQQLQAALTAARQQASQTLAALQECTRRAEKAEETVTTLRTELDDTRSRSSESSNDLERKLTEASALAESLRQQTTALESKERQLQAAVDNLRTQLAAANDAKAEAERRSSESSRSFDEQSKSRLAELEAALSQAKVQTEEATKLAKDREKELSDARVILDDSRAQLDQNLKDTKELESVLDQLRDRLRVEAARSESFAARITELEEAAKSVPAPAEAPTPTAAAPTSDTGPRTLIQFIQGDFKVIEPLRRGRLKVAAKLARDRARKIRKAGEALATRFEQCELVLSMRQDVLNSKRSVEAVHRQQTARDARGKATTAAFFLTCAAGILAGVSWLAAGQVAPETYLAKVTLTADNRDRKLADTDLEEWRNFHKSMLDDPRFLQFASERLAKQGIPALGTPGALKERMKTDMTVSEPNPGELTLQMKGVGKEKLERDLQAIALSIQSQAREARERRIDGASTTVPEAAKAGEGPIESQRIFYAAGIWASLLIVLGGVTGFVWRRLSQAKLQFEAGNSLETVEDNDRWPDLKKAA